MMNPTNSALIDHKMQLKTAQYEIAEKMKTVLNDLRRRLQQVQNSILEKYEKSTDRSELADFIMTQSYLLRGRLTRCENLLDDIGHMKIADLVIQLGDEFHNEITAMEEEISKI